MRLGFVALLAAVATAGMGALFEATDGFRVVTTEGARRLALERNPLLLRDVRLVDQNGHPFSLADYRGRTVLIDFIYTRCPTICGVLGDEFARVLANAPDVRLAAGSGVDLLSISFDPADDDLAALRAYGERYGAAAPHWRIAAPAGQGGLGVLLREFGVVAIPDGSGGFAHSSSVYIVDPEGRLAGILDPGEAAAFVAASQLRAPR